GFDNIERLVDRVSKSSDGYPPYNIERIGAGNGKGEYLRITLAVAGFRRDDLEITVEDRELTIRGRQEDDAKERTFLHRGIAARQFQRTFVLADGFEIAGATLDNGLLSIDVARPETKQLVRRIEIGERK
ncbi:MAG: Hsp20 family protein, partial [Hyphomicrobiaceae bacterium]